jgi:hypothetical protein
MSGRHDISGQAQALSVLTAIRDGHESKLARCLNGLESGPSSPLAAVPATHFARWVVIGDVVYQDKGSREHLDCGQLLFTANFDGELAVYLESLRVGLGESADTIWGHCHGYPGSADAAQFAGYLRAHSVESSLFFAAYGDRTVENVKHSLATRLTLIEFAVRSQGLAPAELQAAFAESFPA